MFLFVGCVSAEVLNPNVDISDEGYEKLAEFMSEVEMGMIDQDTYNMFMEKNVIGYQSYIVETTYVSSSTTLPEKVNERTMTVEEFASSPAPAATCEFYDSSSVCETSMKYMILSVLDLVDGIQFTMHNSWKSMPKYKSFDVMAIRWESNFSLDTYFGEQITNGNTDYVSYNVGNGNYKSGTNAIGLSQNLVDSATEIDNKLYVTGFCSSSGTVYATYQHAQDEITLATSKLYNFSSSGYGNILSFYGNASGIYDNTTGLSVDYIC